MYELCNYELRVLMSSSERRCPELPDPTSGMVSDESRTVDSVATYTCDDRFRICEGTQNRTCRNDSTWDGEAVVCSGEYLDIRGNFERP